uniref:Uncharacterized protein n=1 Tax=Glossina brevipalpis TaxID=37001 RepID=A0A1A9W4J4_9MUSC
MPAVFGVCLYATVCYITFYMLHHAFYSKCCNFDETFTKKCTQSTEKQLQLTCNANADDGKEVFSRLRETSNDFNYGYGHAPTGPNVSTSVQENHSKLMYRNGRNLPTMLLQNKQIYCNLEAIKAIVIF